MAVERLGAIAAIGSFFLVGAFIIAPLAWLTYSRQPNPETVRRNALIQELLHNFQATAGSWPLVGKDFRKAAEPYVNDRLRQMGEP